MIWKSSCSTSFLAMVCLLVPPAFSCYRWCFSAAYFSRAICDLLACSGRGITTKHFSSDTFHSEVLEQNVSPNRKEETKHRTKSSIQEVERKTKIVKQDLNPLWRQSYEFPELGNGEHLQLNCFDADYLNDENLGSARINLEGLEDGVVRDAWIPLENINIGEIRLLIEAYTSESEAETSQSERQEPSMDFQRGLLEVVILEARDLVAADLRGTSDPFVVLHYGDTKRTTKVLYKTLYPQWNESFEMSDSGEPLNLSVKDYNAVLPDVNIGRCAVEYERLPNYQVEDRWIPLQGVRTGEIHVQVIRRPAKLCRSVTTSSKTSDTVPKVLKKSRQVQALLKQALMLSSTGNTESAGKKLEEIEFVEAEKSICLSQLLRERDMLLEKIETLGQALQFNEGGRQIMLFTTKELLEPRQSHK